MKQYVYIAVLEYSDSVEFSVHSTEQKAKKSLANSLKNIIKNYSEELEDTPEKYHKELKERDWFTVYGSYGFSVHGYIRKKEIL